MSSRINKSGKPKVKASKAEREECVQLLCSGIGQIAVAKKLGRSSGWVSNPAREYGLVHRWVRVLL